MRHLGIAIPTGLIATLLMAGVAAAADPLPNFDSRGADRLPAFSSTERAAQSDLRADFGGKAATGRIAASRSAVSITGITDQLTAPSAGDPERIATSYLLANATALGLESSDVGALKLVRSYRSWEGHTYMTWTQTAGGIDSFDNRVGVNVAADGAVMNAWSTAIPGFGSDGKPSLTAAEARGVAGRHVGAAPRGTAALTLFGTPGGTKLAWRIGVAGAAPDTYEVVVDADSGDVLARVNHTDYANNASVYERFPGATTGGTAHTVDLGAPGTGWLTDTTGASGLKGPNAWAWADLEDDCFVDTLTAVSAGCAGPGAGEAVFVSAGGGGTDFNFAVTPFTPGGGQHCPPVSPFCTWDSSVSQSWGPNREQTTTQTFYYVNRFHDHLKLAPIGFDAASGNFEVADRVLVNTDDGGNGPGGFPDADHDDNANFATPHDGTSPVMQMYLFQGNAFRSVNGGDEAVLVYHEYTHGLTNRLVGNGEGLESFQSGAMGEAWSDWYAFDYLVAQGNTVDTGAPGELDPDAYLTHGGAHVVRTEAIDCPVGGTAPACPGTTGAGPGGYTLGDMGKILGFREVHADGEIWGQTLWQIRQAVGSPVAEQLVTDALRASSDNPDFLEQRDLILAADLNGPRAGADIATLWTIFAARGMGVSATSSSPDGIGVTEAFDTPSVVQATGATVSDPAPGGDGDGAAEPGETVRLTASLRNPGPRPVNALSATLSSATATITDATSAFTPASLATHATATNSSPFTVAVPADATCGGTVPLTLSSTSDQGAGSTSLPLFVGGAATPVDSVTDNGSPGTVIPDNDATGLSSTVALTDPGRVADVNVKIDALTHPFISDLTIELISPSGTHVLLVDTPGGGGNNGDDMTNTVFDDQASGGVIGVPPTVVPNVPPYTGTFKPLTPLSRLKGEPLAGTWTLHAKDTFGGDVGNLAKWTLVTSAAACTQAETGGADGISQTGATLRGTVNPRGTSTRYRFEYGTTGGYGAITDPVDVGTTATAAAAAVGGLSPSTVYHYRVVALRGDAVSAAGADATFTTSAVPAVAPPPGGGPPASVAGFVLSRKTLTLDSKGRFTYSFKALAGLKGKATFKSVSRIALKSRAKKVIVTVGSRSFTVSSKGAGKVKVKLARKVFAYVKKHKSIKVAVSVASTSPKGSGKRTFTLKAPKKTKRK